MAASYVVEVVLLVSKKREYSDLIIAEDGRAAFFALKHLKTLLLVQQLSSTDGHIMTHLPPHAV